MKCGGCVSSVEKTLLGHSSVSNASVNLVARTAWVEFNGSDQDLNQLLESLKARGFPARKRDANLLEQEIDGSSKDLVQWWEQWRQLIVALVLLLLSGLGHLAEGGYIKTVLLGSLPFHAALATIALFGPGLKLLRNGVRAALDLTPSMDTLVSLGVGSAYSASLVALIWPGVGWPCFFNEPVMLLGFVLLGRFLEERARFSTGRALKQLAQLQPDVARLLVNDDVIREVRVGALRPGEKVQLLAGDRVPVDGIVLKGHSAVDVSSLTGEPLPLEACPGTQLATGSLNLEATLVLEVQRVGNETALAGIIGLVEQAQARKAPIQGLADRVAGRFCYGVLALALATFLFWWQLGTRIWPQVLHASGQGLIHAHGVHSSLGSEAETSIGLALQLAIAVLVIACPCALGLATPTVITVASGLAAKRGWLFRGGDVIEMASSIRQVIFDKTGTLTVGRPLVSKVFSIKDSTDEKVLMVAASLEQNSRHPLAHAVLQEAQSCSISLLSPKACRTYPGEGLAGEFEGFENTFRVGNPEWVNGQGVLFSGLIQDEIEQAAEAGRSVVCVAEGKELLGLITIQDRIRADAFLSLKRLRSNGFRLSVLSGDRRVAVECLGEALGFEKDQLAWQLLPAQKLATLESFRNLGPIAMVGDGINDAPALAAADLGIAVGTGTQIAQDSADLVLLGDRLEALPDAFLLSRRAMTKVRQNLFWAFGYNLIALPLAAGLLLPGFGLILSPPIAALLMAFSSITVVLNALSLKSA